MRRICNPEIICSIQIGSTNFQFPLSNLGEGSGLLIREAWFESTKGSHTLYGDCMLVSENAGYKLYCEVRKLDVTPQNNYVRIYTTYDWAKNPSIEQNKLELFLSDEELSTLRQSLTL